MLIVLIALGVAVGTAFAKPKVALTPIDGDKNGNLGDAIADALDSSDVDLVAPKAVTRAIDKLGYDSDLSVKQAKKLAKELEVDAVISARYDKEGKHKVLQFSLVVDGKKVRGFRVIFNNAKNRAFKAKVRDKLVERILGDDRGDAPPDVDPEEVRKSEREKQREKEREIEREIEREREAKARERDDKERDDKERDDKERDDKERDDRESSDGDGRDPDDRDGGDGDRRNKRSKRTGERDGDGDGDGDGDDGDGLRTRKKVDVSGANRAAVRVDVGLSVLNRSLSFTQRANFAEGPKPYSNAPVPGARLEAELYPLAFASRKSFIAGLGFGGSFDQTISLKLKTTNEPNTPVTATQRSWSIGARLRIPFGMKASSPTMTLHGGIARRRFRTDKSVLMDAANLDVPDTYYKMFDPGAMFRFPVAGSAALFFGGKGMLIHDAGEIQKPTSYGQATVLGFSATAGVDIVFGKRFALRVAGEFMQVGFTFTGTGELANNRDMDPDTIDIGGATDRSFGGVATFGALY